MCGSLNSKSWTLEYLKEHFSVISSACYYFWLAHWKSLLIFHLCDWLFQECDFKITRRSAIWELIALISTNQITAFDCDFKMYIIKGNFACYHSFHGNLHENISMKWIFVLHSKVRWISDSNPESVYLHIPVHYRLLSTEYSINAQHNFFKHNAWCSINGAHFVD